MSHLHRAWVSESAIRAVLEAPELRPAGQRFVTTPAGVQIGCAHVKPPMRDAGAISGPHRAPARLLVRMLGSTRAWLIVVGMAFAALLLTACSGPTEIEAAQDVAAQVDDARIDEWVQVAQRANPNLTAEDLSRVRAAAMFLEGTRPPPVSRK